MADATLLTLYRNRDEQAIQRTIDIYGSYCRTVAANILDNPQDIEEALADTWLKVWNAVPPYEPKYWNLFLAKIVRSCALDIWRKNHSQRRGSGQADLALEELSQCIPSRISPELQLQSKELVQAISSFLRILPARHRVIFLSRYFYMEDLAVIAKANGMREANVRMLLSRIRQKLRKHLIQEGYL
jgi:RNA polymerase sigma-70 factor (ECF subfamily)